MAPVDNAQERDEKRAAVASEHVKTRDEIEQQYIKDKRELQEAYEQDIRNHNQTLATAYADVGLNPDGSDPQGRPQGSAE